MEEGVAFPAKIFETRENVRNITLCQRGVVDRVTWPEVVQKAERLARFFLDHEIVKKKMAIVGQFCTGSLVAFVACTLTGNSVFVLDATEAARLDFIAEIEAEIIWLDQAACHESVDLSPYASVAKILKVGALPAKVKLETNGADELVLDEFEPKATPADLDVISRSVKPTDILCYSTTSGTTGKPKIIQFGNRWAGEYPTYTNDPTGPCDIWKIFGMFGVCGTLQFLKRKANLGVTANFVSHVYYIIISYCTGKKVVHPTILDQNDFETSTRLLVENQCSTALFYLPRALDFINDKSFGTRDLSQIRMVITIGSQMTRTIYEKIEAAWLKSHGTKPLIISGYGATEVGGLPVRCGLFDKREDQINTVGQIQHGGGVRIIDPETREEINKPDVVGEIEMFTVSRMIGYIGHEQNITWFSPGDYGKYDKKGYLVLLGRIKEQIVLRNTKKTNATAIDTDFQKCGDIEEIATVSVRNDNGYDDIHVFIRCKESAEEKIVKFSETTMKEQLVDAPSVHFSRDPLPRLVNGKYSKGDLLKLAKE